LEQKTSFRHYLNSTSYVETNHWTNKGLYNEFII
jgi:hypothetical protein